MSSEKRKVALLGASGNLGKPLLTALLNNPQFEVTVIARESSTASYGADIPTVKVSDSFPKDELVSAFKGIDTVILAMSHAGNEYHRTLMDAAAEAGVKHLIPNIWDSNAELDKITELSVRTKGNYEDIEYLRTLESSGMVWTAIVTGLLFDLAFPYGLLGFDLRSSKAQIWDDGNSSFSMSTTDDIVAATIAVLRRPSTVANKYVYVSSFETTQNQLLSCVEAVSGQKWTVERVSSADKLKEARETISSGAQGMPWLMAQGTISISACFGGDEYQSDFVRSGRSSNEMLGLPSRSVEDAVRNFI